MITERINKGKKITAEAIKGNMPKLLKDCIAQFIKINAPMEEIQDALSDCPIDLFKEAGYWLVIKTPMSNNPITLGKDITWEALKELVQVAPKKEELKTIIEAFILLNGQVEEVITNRHGEFQS